MYKQFAKAEEMAAKLAAVTDIISQDAILNTYDAIEGFVLFACISMGLIQICSLKFSDLINKSEQRWLRTNTNIIPAEETTQLCLRFSLRNTCYKLRKLALVTAILGHRSVDSELSESTDDTLNLA